MKALCNDKLQILVQHNKSNSTNFRNHVTHKNVYHSNSKQNEMQEVVYNREIGAYNFQSITENFELMFHKKCPINKFKNGRDLIFDLNKTIKHDHVFCILVDFNEKDNNFAIRKEGGKNDILILSNYSSSARCAHEKFYNLLSKLK